MNLLEIGCADVEWSQVAQDRYQWPALVNTVIDLRVPQKARGISLPSEGLLASQVGL
jgi:hypothetical protein